MDINGFSLEMIYTWYRSWWLVRCFPMFSHVFQCFPYLWIIWELAGGHWSVLKPLTWEPEHPGPGLRGYSQGRDRIGLENPRTLQRHLYMLVGGLEHFLYFHILGIITPTDWLIFFRGVEPTNQYIYMSMCILYVYCILYIYYIFGKVIKKSEMLNFRNVYCHMFDFQTSFDRTGGLPEGCLTEGANKIRHYENCKIKHTHTYIYIYILTTNTNM